MRFTIITYNVERGFHSRRHKLNAGRLAAAQKAVRMVNPDILALTESCYGGKNSQKITMNYQEIFGFPYGKFGGYPCFGPRKGNEGGNCLLSKYPMEAEVIKLASKGAVRGRITLEDTVLTIDVVHPSCSMDDLKKIQTLEPLILKRARPYMMTGDLNTVHPDDHHDWGRLRDELMEFDKKMAYNIISCWQQAVLVRWLLGIGLSDAFPESRRESTVPTPYAFNEPRAGVRMDFFFVSPEIKVIDAYVLKDKNTAKASDHYPIVGVFDVKQPDNRVTSTQSILSP